MSYTTWITKGYGICVDDIKAECITFGKLATLCKLSPTMYEEFRSGVLEYIENDIDADTPYRDLYDDEGMLEAAYQKALTDGDVLDFMDLANGMFGESGLTYYLKRIIEELEGIEIVWADDYDCTNYLLLTPHYPWSNISEKEKNMTEDDATEMFTKYVHIFTDEPVTVDYYNVENGG